MMFLMSDTIAPHLSLSPWISLFYACFGIQLLGSRTATTSPRTHTSPLADTVAVTTILRPAIAFTFPRTSKGTPKGVGRM